MTDEKDNELKQRLKLLKEEELKIWHGSPGQPYLRRISLKRAKTEILKLLSPEAEAKWKTEDHDFDPYLDGFSPYDVTMALDIYLFKAIEALLELEKEGKIKPISDDILAGVEMPQIVIELI